MSKSLDITNAITKLTFYGETSWARYEVFRQGIKHNEHSEEQPQYGKWTVIKRFGGSPSTKYLLTNGTWEGLLSPDAYDTEIYFDTLNAAVLCLQESIHETLSTM